MPLPSGWEAVQSATPANDPNHPSVERSLTLLQQTFPARYTNLNPAMLRNKMRDRDHTSGGRFPGLRIFSRMTGGNVDITAFAFLRLNFCPQAFVLTMGTSLADDQLLYTDLLGIVKEAQSHPKVPRIEIVNLNMLPGDLNETAAAVTVGRTIQRGLTATTIQPIEDIFLGRPWRRPGAMFKRWQCIAP